jgi:hypothetical protein
VFLFCLAIIQDGPPYGNNRGHVKRFFRLQTILQGMGCLQEMCLISLNRYQCLAVLDTLTIGFHRMIEALLEFHLVPGPVVIIDQLFHHLPVFCVTLSLAVRSVTPFRGRRMHGTRQDRDTQTKQKDHEPISVTVPPDSAIEDYSALSDKNKSVQSRRARLMV